MMKRLLLPALMMTACPLPAHAIDFIRQIQLISGQSIVYDLPIAQTSGEIRSRPIEGDGAIFQLYAYEDSIFSPFTVLDLNALGAVHANVSLSSNLLDLKILGIHLDINLGNDPSPSSLPKLLAEKTVGAYIPEALVQLHSADPYYPPRTRADQPYTATIAISRLPTPEQELPPGVPTKVTLEKSYKLYDSQLHIPAPNGTGQGTYSEGIEFNLNGTFTIPNQYQNLPGPSPTSVIGEETFSAYVHLGSGNTQARVGSATIQVWPVAGAEIRGLEAGKRYNAIPNNADVVLTNVYPASDTYAQVYKGTQALGRDGFKIPSSFYPLNTYAPQNQVVVPLFELEEGIAEDGTYTVEVLTITPFNNGQPERLAHLTFEVKRNLSLKGSLTTME